MQLKSSNTPTVHNLGETSRERAERSEEMLMRLANAPDWPAIGEPSQFKRHIAAVDRMRKLYPEAYKHCSTIDLLALRELLRKAWTSPNLRCREWFVFLLRKFHSDSLRRVQALREDAAGMVREWRDKKALLDVAFPDIALLNRLRRRRRLKPLRPLDVDTLMKPKKIASGLGVIMAGEQAAAAFKAIGPPQHSQFEEAAFHLQRNLHHARRCLNPECPAPYFFVTKKGQKYCSTGKNECATMAQRESKRRWWNENRAKPKRRKSR